MKKQKRLWIEYDERGVLHEDTYGYNGPYTGFRNQEIFFELKNITREDRNKQFFKHSQEVSDETFESNIVYAVVVRFTEGGTFCRIQGNWTIPFITHSKEEANDVAERIKKDDYGKHNRWQGYFERLEDVDVVARVVS